MLKLFVTHHTVIQGAFWCANTKLTSVLYWPNRPR